MGYQTLAIQKKGSEVWKVLGATKLEFEKFGGLMDRVQKNIGTVQNTLRDVGTRTRAITRTLRNVETGDIEAADASELLGASGVQERDLQEPDLTVTAAAGLNTQVTGSGRLFLNNSGPWLRGSNGTTENFIRIGHSLFALIVAFLGGHLSRHLYAKNLESVPGPANPVGPISNGSGG